MSSEERRGIRRMSADSGRGLRSVRTHWGEVDASNQRLHAYAHDLGLRPASENVLDDEMLEARPNNRAEIGLPRIGHRPVPSLTLRFSFSSLDSLLKVERASKEAFCDCYTGKDKKRDVDCSCGEEDADFDWVWDLSSKSQATQLQNGNREVRFHTEYSCGTAAVRGSQPMTADQHYWEIKMTSPVYGTDMMVGVGTGDSDLNRHCHNFCSFLGIDCETWGLSYTGLFHHQGEAHCYGPRFGQGSIIGVHLDMWNGTLAFYKNRRPLGVACSGLKGKTLFPMVSSTAARSRMKMICSRSFTSSLQYLCCLALRRIIPAEKGVLDSLSLPPGLSGFLQNNLGWLLGPTALINSWEPTSTASQCVKMPGTVSGPRDISERTANNPLGTSFQPSNEEPLPSGSRTADAPTHMSTCEKFSPSTDLGSTSSLQNLKRKSGNNSGSDDDSSEDESELVQSPGFLSKRKHTKQ